MLVCSTCGRENPDGARFCNECAAPLRARPSTREVRKTVTVLFCDLTGSTALGESTDPEALRELLARYFDRMKEIVERHGGSVEKFIGDAVMAVFGVPVVHEDDALRACRAAVEMRDALPALGINGRIGVNTGEVVTGTEERLATGDAVNVAARLEQAAQPGQVLIGQPTLALVRGAVEVEAVAPLELKGKSEPVPASRLVAVTGEVERRFGTTMVGRERELRSLLDALARAVADRSCQLFTVLGSAGVGKTRLAAEFIAAAEARVVRGRCLSYGDGITYWPVVEVIKQLGTLPGDDAAAEPLRSLLGESSRAATADEIGWGFRKLLEQEAQAVPLVCVFDDLHWGEPTFLALVETVAELSRDAPIVLLCMARPELLELRPSWGGGMWNATTVLLEPLDATETSALLDSLGGVDAELAARIAASADGNPLFLEEMLALVRASSDGHVEVPPTIQALLAARLDQLDVDERAVLERGSIEGQVFHRGSVEALADGEPQDARLLALVRKQLVRPDKPQLPAEDAYRFRHLLIRDAAYDALPKGVRADLHRRFAGWLEVHGSNLVELEEILGYHLEQAALYLVELGRPDESLAAEAASRLASAGRRAIWRLDRKAAQSLLQRAVALSEHPDVHIVVNLARTSTPHAGAALLDAAAERADRDHDVAGGALARAAAAYNRAWSLEVSLDEQERLALEALPLLEAAGDHAGLAEIWNHLAQGAYNGRCAYAEMEHASLQALRHAELAGHPPRYGMIGVALVWGPRPAPEALQLLQSIVGDLLHPGIQFDTAILIAMTGRLDEAGIVAQAAEDQLRQYGGEEEAAGRLADLALLSGDYRVGADNLRRVCEGMRERRLAAGLGTYASMHGRVLCELGEFDEAETLAEEGRNSTEPDDPVSQALWRQVIARVLAHRGSYGEAERVACEAVEWIERSDGLWARGDALSDLAGVLEAAGRNEDARAVLQDALAVYEQKGIVPLVQRTKDRLAALQPSIP